MNIVELTKYKLWLQDRHFDVLFEYSNFTGSFRKLTNKIEKNIFKKISKSAIYNSDIRSKKGFQLY